VVTTRRPRQPILLLPGGAGRTLQERVYSSLRDAIIEERLVRGARVPASRALAQEWNVARNTVLRAMERLVTEGYIEAHHGAGSFVCRELPDAGPPRVRKPRPAVASAAQISRRGRAIAEIERRFAATMLGDGAAFRIGTPALDAFPADAWGAHLARVWKRSSATLVRHRDPAGLRVLREAIATYVHEARGVRCTADQIIIVGGSQQAMRILGDVLLDPGDRAWVEDPGYLGSHSALVAAGAEVVPVPVDDEGMSVAAGRRLATDARLAIVTPSNQFPLMVTMSMRRRRQLLAWARERSAWIVEDDYDSEFRFSGRPLPALQGLDRAGRVVYVGTFSKLLSAAIRIGYVVLPPSLVEPFVLAKTANDGRSPALEQAALASFLDDGQLGRHVRRMRTLYAQRRAVLEAAIAEHLDDVLELAPAAAGMHALAYLRDGRDDRAYARRASDAGVVLYPLSKFRVAPGRPGVLLGFAGANEREIVAGVRALADMDP
jgi:GntR family transcriptional regulator/MocR family aminotransferase